MRASSDFANGVNTTYLLPLIALLKQTAQLYQSGFNQFPTVPPAQGGQEKENDRKAYERMREASANAYASLSLMADNLNNAIYTNVSKKDISRYMANKQVLSAVFTKNPLPVAPGQPAPAPLQPAGGQPGAQPGGQPGGQPATPPLSPQVGPAQPQGTIRTLSQADMTEVLQSIAGLAGREKRVPYVGESTIIYDATGFGQRQPALRVKDIITQVIGDVREALNLSRNTKVSQKNSQLGASVYNTNRAFFQELSQGAIPQALQATPGFQNRISVGGPATPPPAQGQAQPGGGPAIQPLNPIFNSAVDIPNVAGDATREIIATAVKRQERHLNHLLNPDDLREVSSVLTILKRDYPATYEGIRDRDVANGGQPLDDATILTDDIEPVVRAITNAKNYHAQQGNFQGNQIGSVDELIGLGRQRSYLEDRKRLAEMALGDPRSVDMSQGRERREKFMPFINEFDPKAEFLKRRGEVLAGGIEYGVNENINDLLPYEVYGGNVNNDDEEMTPFKRRIGMPNPFAPPRRVDTLPVRPVFASNATDIDESLVPYSDIFSGARSGHEKEKEKPKDMDEDPDPIRITNENYKIFTGKQKAPKYKISSLH
jgi:hypothetical protein